MSSSNFLLLIFIGTMNSNWHSTGFISRLKKFSKHVHYKKTIIQTGYLELMYIPGVSEEQLYHQMCEAFPAILSLVIKKKKVFLALYLEIINFSCMTVLQKPIYLCPPRENQLATNVGLKDYITVLAIGYLIALKPTMKSSDFQTAFI